MVKFASSVISSGKAMRLLSNSTSSAVVGAVLSPQFKTLAHDLLSPPPSQVSTAAWVVAAVIAAAKAIAEEYRESATLSGRGAKRAGRRGIIGACSGRGKAGGSQT